MNVPKGSLANYPGHKEKRNGRNWESRTYTSYNKMLQRCYIPGNISYHNYGGKGITVCERWHQFKNFLEDMGERPEGTSLDRIDGNKGYSPDNCRWEGNSIQNRNTKKKIYKKTNAIVSKYRNVSDMRGKWLSRVRILGIKNPIYIGIFTSEKEAALAYNQACIEWFGPNYEFLNVIEE